MDSILLLLMARFKDVVDNQMFFYIIQVLMYKNLKSFIFLFDLKDNGKWICRIWQNKTTYIILSYINACAKPNQPLHLGLKSDSYI